MPLLSELSNTGPPAEVVYLGADFLNILNVASFTGHVTWQRFPIYRFDINGPRKDSRAVSRGIGGIGKLITIGKGIS